jgi:fatty acid-binding protein DegV
MRKVKIVADSSANLLTLERVDFASAPLKIITSDREFVDDAQLDIPDMAGYEKI